MERRVNMLVGVSLLVLSTAAAVESTRLEQWTKVEEATRKGLPKTAIKALEPIVAGALADKAYAEAVKALCRKISLEGIIEGNKPEEKIKRLQEAIGTVPEAVRPVLQAVLRHIHKPARPWSLPPFFTMSLKTRHTRWTKCPGSSGPKSQGWWPN